MENSQSRLPIEKVAFGVRYTPQYRVRDNMGTLIDHILRSDQFGPETFPQSEAGPHRHTLRNPDNEGRLGRLAGRCTLGYRLTNQVPS